ncbi:MAG: 2-phosphosulfolactate phosphatase [Bacteroidetes bacterium]|nr:2-phosphosulfolactate phosphatase [Bacteroidota bacterium]
MNINVLFTPSELPKSSENSESIAVVIDVLRASTTIAVALSSGAIGIIPTTSITEATATYLRLQPSIRFLGGERKGIKPSGFDAGNSPFEYMPEHVSGKTISFTTSNGTTALKLSANATNIYIGSFVNLSAVVHFISSQHNSNYTDITIVCAGSGGNFSIEDAVCAGGFVQMFSKKYPQSILTDSAVAAEILYNKHKLKLVDFLRNTTHGKLLGELGFSDDIECAGDCNSLVIVPFFDGKMIVKAN